MAFEINGKCTVMETKVIISVFLNRKSNLKFFSFGDGRNSLQEDGSLNTTMPVKKVGQISAAIIVACCLMPSPHRPHPEHHPACNNPHNRFSWRPLLPPEPHRFCLSRGLVTTPPISSGSFPAPLKPPSGVLPS